MRAFANQIMLRSHLVQKEDQKESPARGSPGLLSQRIVVRLHDGGTSGIQLRRTLLEANVQYGQGFHKNEEAPGAGMAGASYAKNYLRTRRDRLPERARGE